MSSRLARDFDRVLLRLFEIRTHQVRSLAWPRPGSPPKLTKRKIKNAVSKLQDIAQDAWLHSKPGRKILRDYDYKKQWHAKKGKGHGRPAKRKSFKAWYEKNIQTKNCVYVFWASRRRCLYVGRTLNGKGRPTSHFEKHWFGRATRVDVFGFDRKRDVPRFECVYTHRHQPWFSRITPGSKKYYARCPVCHGRREIRSEIKSVFRLK
jgi:hypothetical protein